MKYQKSLFIFRRDLRLQDNTGLLAALQNSKQVLLAFIFDQKQVSTQNKFLSFNALEFMLQSLHDLQQDVKKAHGKIYFFSGDYINNISNLITECKIDAIFTNQDYTPFSLQRDLLIQQICKQKKIDFCQFQDLLLTNPDQVRTGTGKIYQVFTAFYKSVQVLPVPRPVLDFTDLSGVFHTGPIKHAVDLSAISKQILPVINHKLVTKGGSSSAAEILKKITDFKNYLEFRDLPSEQTTHLSAHLKFGTISIRVLFYEIVKKLGIDHALIRQLYWRDFFTYIAYHHQHVFGYAFNKKYDHINWSHSSAHFKLWCEGKTGFPIVDAGMRQLNETGFMHNRVRMIVASFLVKDLHLDWRLGEQYFAQKLADYDPAVNNGNWQWVAGTGCDAQPYFRVFNPWLQQKKFDPECEYIKTWLPELKLASAKTIHNWFKQQDAKFNYPKPILDHSLAAKQAINLYK